MVNCRAADWVRTIVRARFNSGTVLRLKGKGAPRNGGRGDEYVTLKVVLPAKPDPELANLVGQWSGRDYNPRHVMEA